MKKFTKSLKSSQEKIRTESAWKRLVSFSKFLTDDHVPTAYKRNLRILLSTCCVDHKEKQVLWSADTSFKKKVNEIKKIK